VPRLLKVLIMPRLSADALAQLFTSARSHNGFSSDPIPRSLIQELFDLLKWAPTSMNSQPARFVFVTSPEAKARLSSALMEGNVEKTLAAPVTVIVAQDTRFFDHLPTQFPAWDAKPLFENNAELARVTMFRNSSLQGAYLMLAARALGLDVGPMSGFDAAKVNEAFFPDGRFEVNFLCNLGMGLPGKLHPRGPRLDFEVACQMV
jgi:3-hydroxypropanoate dehydrogenase